ncbi:hypothetical protein ACH492_25570 [Streptomyces sp. NPDC019443]|uniref:hypothetical protein n=1 Tax=Streptomyces sp. NPDC019443 TaxID=3365061 RepID=UPI0037A6136D
MEQVGEVSSGLDALLVILELSRVQRAYVRGEQHWDPVARPEWALKSDRQSLPSLLMVSQEVAAIVNRDYAKESAGRDYLDRPNALTRTDRAS